MTKATMKTSESKYKASEIAEEATTFGVTKECAEAALKVAGKSEVTMAEAEKLIKEFMMREVQ